MNGPSKGNSFHSHQIFVLFCFSFDISSFPRNCSVSSVKKINNSLVIDMDLTLAIALWEQISSCQETAKSKA